VVRGCRTPPRWLRRPHHAATDCPVEARVSRGYTCTRIGSAATSVTCRRRVGALDLLEVGGGGGLAVEILQRLGAGRYSTSPWCSRTAATISSIVTGRTPCADSPCSPGTSGTAGAGRLQPRRVLALDHRVHVETGTAPTRRPIVHPVLRNLPARHPILNTPVRTTPRWRSHTRAGPSSAAPGTRPAAPSPPPRPTAPAGPRPRRCAARGVGQRPPDRVGQRLFGGRRSRSARSPLLRLLHFFLRARSSRICSRSRACSSARPPPAPPARTARATRTAPAPRPPPAVRRPRPAPARPRSGPLLGAGVGVGVSAFLAAATTSSKYARPSRSRWPTPPTYPSRANTPRTLARDFPREIAPRDSDQRLEFTAKMELTADRFDVD